MNAQCADGFLYHRWTIFSSCVRCGVSTGSSAIRGTLRDERWEVSPSESALLSQAHLVDPASRHDSHPESDAASLAASADALANLGEDLIPAFLRRQVH